MANQKPVKPANKIQLISLLISLLQIITNAGSCYYAHTKVNLQKYKKIVDHTWGCLLLTLLTVAMISASESSYFGK